MLNKKFFLLLIADHGAPIAIDDTFDSGQEVFHEIENFSDPNWIDAFDYYGYWKFADGLINAAFFGVDREYALGNTPQQTNLGTWGDGTPVTPAVRILPGGGYTTRN